MPVSDEDQALVDSLNALLGDDNTSPEDYAQATEQLRQMSQKYGRNLRSE